MILIEGQRGDYTIVFKGDIPVLIAYHPGYCRPTCVGGIEAALTRAAGTPISVCDVHACVCMCMHVYVCAIERA